MQVAQYLGAYCAFISTVFVVTTHTQTPVRPESSALSRQQLFDTARSIVGQQGLICDVIELAGSKQPTTILASVDNSGRHFCNTILRIRNSPGPTVLDSFDGWKVERLSSVVRDIDQDGNPELVVPKAWSDYEGAEQCQPTLNSVYQCIGGTCREAPKQFREFYGSEVARLQARIRVLESAANNMSDGGEGSCLIMERDKIQRLLGVDDRAGFDMAEQWMVSNDASARRRAVAVFADIGDAISRTHLQNLARDSDRVVAVRAEVALRKLSRK